jgi:hypothetical protein
MPNVPYTKFLGLVIDETLTWNNHIDQLISRLNSVCYPIRAVEQHCQGNFKNAVFFYVHSITSYSIIFGVTSLMVLKYSERKEKCYEL